MPPSAAKTVLVIDTSVLVSAFLFPQSKPAMVLDLVFGKQCTGIINDIIVSECERALKRPKLQKPYNIDPAHIKSFIVRLKKDMRVLGEVDLDEIDICRDPDDNHVLAAARATRADYIISGDKDLLDLGLFETTRILDVNAFLGTIDGR